MALMTTRGGPRTDPIGAGAIDATTMTVLLSRNAPSSDLPTVSVGSLLRREGRAPHAVDRPVRPRASQQAELPAAAAVPSPRMRRRTVVVAGTLLAAGSVVGAVGLADYSSSDSAAGRAGTSPVGPHPGRGLLDATDAPAPAPVRPELGAVASPSAPPALDAGQAPPTSWTPIAFPPTAEPRGPDGGPPIVAGDLVVDDDEAEGTSAADDDSDDGSDDSSDDDSDDDGDSDDEDSDDDERSSDADDDDAGSRSLAGQAGTERSTAGDRTARNLLAMEDLSLDDVGVDLSRL